MSRYKRGEVVNAPLAFYDNDLGYFRYKIRPCIVIDVLDESVNVTIAGTTQIKKASKYPGITVLENTDDWKAMRIDKSTFFYCNETVNFNNNDLKRLGTCPTHLMQRILRLLKYTDY